MEKMAGKYSFVSQDKFKDWLKAEGTLYYVLYTFHDSTDSLKFWIDKGGGTGEALKLKLHLNSEVYKRGNFQNFG